MLSFARFHCLQGSTVAPLYNYLLQQAANGGQFGAVVDVLTVMRASGLDVDPAVAAMVRLLLPLPLHLILICLAPAGAVHNYLN
jgi:hypothetical protein